jgi:tetratricopeptide (TPR) repeat protein
MNRILRASSIALLIVLGAWIPSLWKAGSPKNESSEPFFEGLGAYTRTITTNSRLAQQYFAQGLAFLYSFNHYAAFQSFSAAAANDPQCAMAFWGMGMAYGPHINNMTVPSEHASLAWSAAIRAQELAVGCTPVERALIGALSKRYSDDPSTARKPLDEAYTTAMRDVYRRFPDDADVGALYAEAILDLNPWQQWTPDGAPREGTEEVLRVLDLTLRHARDHPFASHLLIHALEASPHPERANAAAEFLRTYASGMDHLLHMPSHIDVRLGHWHAAVVSNERAIAAQHAYKQAAGRAEPYTLADAHNYHVLTYASMMSGQYDKAQTAVARMLSEIPEDFLAENAKAVDGYMAIRYEVWIRFGRWNEILAAQAPPDQFPVTTALWHWSRATAFAARSALPSARGEYRAFRSGAARLSGHHVRDFPAPMLCDLAGNVLEGELLYREGNIAGALERLRNAVYAEDALPYGEPPYWFIPVRHVLGATLMHAHRYAEAEAVYRDDLKRRPENGWALFGLLRSLHMQHKKETILEASTLSARFEEAWKDADFKLASSCCCLPTATDVFEQ